MRLKTFEKMSNYSIISETAYFNCIVKTITNNNQINDALYSPLAEILSKIAVWVSEGSGWTINSIDHHYLNIVSYSPLVG